jgi:uncharacterized protein with ATP-grasp and redox domains
MNKEDCLKIIKRIQINWDWFIGKGITINDIADEMAYTFNPVPMSVANGVLNKMISENSELPTLPLLRSRCSVYIANFIQNADITGGMGVDYLKNAQDSELNDYQKEVKKQLTITDNFASAKAWAIGSVMKIKDKGEIYQDLLLLENTKKYKLN